MKPKEEAFGCLNILIILFFLGCGFSIYRILANWTFYKYVFPADFRFLSYIGLASNILMFVFLIFLASYRRIGFIGVVAFSVLNVILNVGLQVEVKYLAGNIIGILLLVILTFMNWAKFK